MSLIRAIVTVKIAMTKEKYDRQMTKKAAATVFMKIIENYNKNFHSHIQFIFNRCDELDKYRQIDITPEMPVHNTSGSSNKPYTMYIYQERRRYQGNNLRGRHIFGHDHILVDIFSE